MDLALQASAEAGASIRTKGGISPSKRIYSNISPPTGKGFNIVGQALLRQFQDVLGDPDQGELAVNDTHLALLIDYNKRLKVMERINVPSEVERRDLDIVEIQNRLGPRDPDEVTCSIAGELSATRTVIRHLTDVMLTEGQRDFVKVLYDKYKVNLSTFDEYVVKTGQTMFEQLIPYIKRLQEFQHKHTLVPPVGVVRAPTDYLDSRLQALEAGLRRVEQGGASPAPPPSTAIALA